MDVLAVLLILVLLYCIVCWALLAVLGAVFVVMSHDDKWLMSYIKFVFRAPITIPEFIYYYFTS